MSKKVASLAMRPEPPAVMQIVDDIKASGDNDIVFTVLGGDEKESRYHSMLDESVFSCDASPKATAPGAVMHNVKTKHKTTDDSMEPDIDTVYKQAVEFIDVTEQLRSAPDKLQSQCSTLQEVGKELTDSIKKLQEQTQVVLRKIDDGVS